MINFGYLLIVNNDKTGEYHNMASILANSIIRTQPKGYDSVCLITDDKTRVNSDIAYQRVVYTDDTIKGWDQRNYMLKYSPYLHTVCLDVDMFFTRDISHWIDYFINKSSGLVITDKVLKFNNQPITSVECRPGYKENNIPILYSGFTYFNKSKGITQKFFKLVDYITQNKDTFKNLYMSNNSPKVVGTDEVFSIAAHILGIEDKVKTTTSFPKFVHLKSELQDEIGVESINLDLGYYLDDNANITVGNFLQTEIIHYSEKQFPGYQIHKLYKRLFLSGFKNV